MPCCVVPMPSGGVLWQLAVAVARAELPLFDVVVAWAPSQASPPRMLDAPQLVAEMRASVLACRGAEGEAGAEYLAEAVADAAAYAQLVDDVEEEQHCIHAYI